MPINQNAGKGLLLAGLTLTMSALPLSAAYADYTINRLSRGIPAALQTEATLQTLQPEERFEAELQQDVHYKQYTLPTGTRFIGKITESRASRRWGRPGYIVFRTDEAVLPNGEHYTFDPATYPHKKSHHPRTLTFAQAVALQIPYTVASSALTIPVTIATGANPYSMALAGEGLRMALGSAIWLFRPSKRHDPVPKRIAEGALDGSGVTRAVSFVTKEPNPQFGPNDPIKLYFERDELLGLFKASSISADANQPEASTLNP